MWHINIVDCATVKHPAILQSIQRLYKTVCFIFPQRNFAGIFRKRHLWTQKVGSRVEKKRKKERGSLGSFGRSHVTRGQKEDVCREGHKLVATIKSRRVALAD